MSVSTAESGWTLRQFPLSEEEYATMIKQQQQTSTRRVSQRVMQKDDPKNDHTKNDVWTVGGDNDNGLVLKLTKK